MANQKGDSGSFKELNGGKMDRKQKAEQEIPILDGNTGDATEEWRNIRHSI